VVTLSAARPRRWRGARFVAAGVGASGNPGEQDHQGRHRQGQCSRITPHCCPACPSLLLVHTMHFSAPSWPTTDTALEQAFHDNQRRGARTQPATAQRTRAGAVCDSYPMLSALLRQYIRPYRRLVAVLMALQLISTLASLYLPTVNATIIDDGVAKGDTTTIVRLGVVMLGVTGLQVLCSIG